MEDEHSLEAALDRLSSDGLVAFPTETVWGLGARALSEPAMARLRAWKGRGEAQPVSVLVDGCECLEEYGFAPSALARLLMERFWPGPVTFVLPCAGGRGFAASAERGRFARGVAREDGAVGLRCSTHPAAAALARGARERGLGPITATSLNRSGEPPAKTRGEALAQCSAAAGEDTQAGRFAAAGEDTQAGRFAAAGEDTQAGRSAAAGEVFCFAPEGQDAAGEAPSSVIDLTGPEPRILRPGPWDRDILAAARAATD